MPKKFPPEFKRDVVRVARRGDLTHAEVAADFAEFVHLIRGRLPNAEILFIGWNPSPARWGQTDKIHELNRLVREMALGMPHVGYIDAASFVLGDDDLPRRELFAEDALHFSPEGYKLLADRVRPFLRK